MQANSELGSHVQAHWGTAIYIEANNAEVQVRNIFLLCVLFLVGCVSKPSGIEPVSNFELNRYLGKWYEIARLDHSFERGLTKVTATYALRDDGGVSVTNSGFDTRKGKWERAEGKAYFVNGSDSGYLKVSFFGPFYGAYVIFELDTDNYQYAFVSGPNRDFLWLLAREPVAEPELIEKFVAEAELRGFDVDELIYVEH